MRHKLRENEYVSAALHLVGVVLSVVALVLLVGVGIAKHQPWQIVSFAIFGSSLVLLYLASTLYHFLPLFTNVKQVFRRIDHAMIFVLIAGTYTPICLVPLWGAWGWSLLGVVWAMALTGVLLKAWWVKIPSWVSVCVYLFMGWMGAALAPMLNGIVHVNALWWLLAGGIFYSVGVVFYVLEKALPPIKWFGMHEVFHVWVLAGSVCHFWLMWKYIGPLG